MMNKKYLLFPISILLVAIVCYTPFYHQFIVSRVISPDESIDFFYQKDHMDIEERKVARFGTSYLLFRNMARDFSGRKGIVILLPPQEYIKAMHFDDIAIPEPCEFYYFTGVNAVNINSPNVREADWAIQTFPGSIAIAELNMPGQLDTLLALYQRYNTVNQ